ncbi:zinc finger C2H2 domain-containing protein [Candidatus Nitrososphaera gargensis Ga9.2]|uniref:Zinc finger C2H2 domain-containing protein n=1 Tax=Nitrososphaera gargensis (strain Ga9.2) TaxID=1237085 RepID=K0IMS9_NITGG|nr:DUF2795 domain-containing protein [Candidatus Nitrososphaera gargensis]AFU58159.1 zinc finger C2H2 domain-containing protein [Candidatus Nitrososphaera gargensis Ga9.2]
MSEETPISGPSSSSRFVCKVCGNTFDRRDVLNEHIAEAHHQKRTVTVNDIVNGVFEGKINLPKTKAEIVQYVEENKDKPAVTPEVIQVVKNMPDKQYFDEADLAYGIEQGIR